MRKYPAAVLAMAILPIGSAFADDAAAPHQISLIPIYCSLIAIATLTGILFIYAWGLRDRMVALVSSSATQAANGAASTLADFNTLPMGLPRGTVRAILALIIVFGSIIFLAISLINGADYKFPETLSGILGAILGFYFGKGTGADDGTAVKAVAAAAADAKQARDQAADATQQAQTAQQQVSDAQAQTQQVEQDKTAIKATADQLAGVHLDTVQATLKQAADFSTVLSGVLPGQIGRDIGAAAGGLTATAAAVADLQSGDVSGAVAKASDLLASATPNLPVVQVLTKAVAALAPVIGTVFPPLTLITTIIGVGSKLGAVAYAHWIARVMDAPYTPAQFSPSLIDSNAAVTLVEQVPVLAKSLRRGVAAGRPGYGAEGGQGRPERGRQRCADCGIPRPVQHVGPGYVGWRRPGRAEGRARYDPHHRDAGRNRSDGAEAARRDRHGPRRSAGERRARHGDDHRVAARSDRPASGDRVRRCGRQSNGRIMTARLWPVALVAGCAVVNPQIDQLSQMKANAAAGRLADNAAQTIVCSSDAPSCAQLHLLKGDACYTLAVRAAGPRSQARCAANELGQGLALSEAEDGPIGKRAGLRRQAARRPAHADRHAPARRPVRHRAIGPGGRVVPRPIPGRSQRSVLPG